jgi:hypothetical protein
MSGNGKISNDVADAVCGKFRTVPPLKIMTLGCRNAIMTEDLKGYSAKGKAKTALERQAAKLPEEVEVLGVDYKKGEDGKWYGHIDVEMTGNVEVPFVLEAMAGFHVVMSQPVEQPADDKPAPATKPRGPRGHSTIDGPCYTTWAVADDMEGAKRGEVIKACQELGVAFYTARTQYQKWSKARKGGDRSMPAKKEQPSEE